MREPVWRSLLRLAAPAVVIMCLAPSLIAPRQAAHAAPSVSVSIINARIGLVHFSGSGFPANRQLYLTLVGSTIANPNDFVRYISLLTTPTGSFEIDYPSGVFMCGTTVRLVVSDDQDTLAESAPLLGQCPVLTPSVTITGVSGGLIGISGKGFAVQETVGISVTSLLTGAITGTTTLSDSTGAFSATAPLGPIGCGETILAFARGGAGSLATSAPFFYNCLPPQPGEPAHAAPPTDPAQSAGQSGASPHHHPVRGVRLDVSNSPPTVVFRDLETVRISTGAPGATLSVHLTALGKALASYTVRADAHGEATLSYRVPMHLAPGKQETVSYTVSYRMGRLQFQHVGSFTVVGS
jgi:hypothetical protein